MVFTNAGNAGSRHVMREPEDEGLKEESSGGRVSHKGEEEILRSDHQWSWRLLGVKGDFSTKLRLTE